MKPLLTDSWHPAERVHVFVSLCVHRKVPKIGPKVRCVGNTNVRIWNFEMTFLSDISEASSTQLLTDSWHPAKRVHAFVSLWANRKVPKMGPKVRCVGNANEWEYGILR